MRDKERTLGRQKRREGRGKGEARGASFPGTAEHALQRKQVFAAALKRVNNEFRRLHDLAARTAHVEAARKALALHRAANFTTYPAAGATANEGMVPKASPRRRKIIRGAKIGRCRSRRESHRRCATREVTHSGLLARIRRTVPEQCRLLALMRLRADWQMVRLSR